MEDSTFVLHQGSLWLAGVISEVDWDLNGLSTGSVDSWLLVLTTLMMSRSLWLGALLAIMLLVLLERPKDLRRISVVTVNFMWHRNFVEQQIWHHCSMPSHVVPAGTLRVCSDRIEGMNPTKNDALPAIWLADKIANLSSSMDMQFLLRRILQSPASCWRPWVLSSRSTTGRVHSEPPIGRTSRTRGMFWLFFGIRAPLLRHTQPIVSHSNRIKQDAYIPNGGIQRNRSDRMTPL